MGAVPDRAGVAFAFGELCVSFACDGSIELQRLHHVSAGFKLHGGASIIQPYQWSHISMVFDLETSEVKLYHNGSLISEDQVRRDLLPSSGASFTLGLTQPTTSQGPFDGLIDDVRVWLRLQTNKQIKNTWNKPNTHVVKAHAIGLFGAWDFDVHNPNKEESIVRDLSSRFNHGKLSAMVITNSKLHTRTYFQVSHHHLNHRNLDLCQRP